VDRVVVVGAAGLRWDDVDPAATPHLAAAARSGSTGTLSVRSAPAVTCPADGWLTLGAGGYAAAHHPDDVDPRLGCAGRPVPVPVPASPPSGTGATVPATAALNDRLRFDARAGWLAGRVPCTTAVGRGAALAAADAAGTVAHYVPGLPATPAAVAEVVARCPATLVDAGALPEDGGRAAGLAALDAVVGAVRSGVPEGTVVMVLGVAETTADRGRLHVAVVEGPGFGPGWLSSASTRRPPYVQLADVAPTIAGLLGDPPPDEVAGRPFVGGVAGRPPGPDTARGVLVDADARAVGHRSAVAPFFAGLGATVVPVSAGLAALLRRRARARPVPVWAVSGLRAVALGLAGVPAATFLANAVPWWRSGRPTAAVAGAVAAWAVSLWAAATLAGRRADRAHRPRVEVGTLGALSLAVVVGDVVSGARLQIDSLLGYNPIVAGRFVGVGNIAFAVLGASAVVVAAQAARGRTPRRALAGVAAVAVPVVAVDGWPRWGADVGGVLTLVPAFTVLALVVAGRRVRAVHAAAGCLAGVVAAGAIGWLDHLRPPDQRSHLGRFVGTALEGGALGTIQRKAEASLDLLLMAPHTVAAAAASVALALVVARPPAVLRAAYARHPCLRPMHLATLVLAGVGLAVNDSIVAVPMVVALVTVPLTLVLCAAEPAAGPAGAS
jgi:hypothetical protein